MATALQCVECSPLLKAVWTVAEPILGLALLIAGLVLFFAPHILVTDRARRAALIARIGDGAYKALFSLISIAGIVAIAYGFGLYRQTQWIDIWNPPTWTRHIAVALMWPASICVVAAYIRGDIQRVLKHPMLVGVKLWAAAHLISNGDLGSIILFGAILAWAGYDRISLKYRADPGAPPIPTGGRRNDFIAVIVGTLLYLALGFLFHPLVVGIPVFGTPAHGI
jgi:uncharacterized membrane protein